MLSHDPPADFPGFRKIERKNYDCPICKFPFPTAFKMKQHMDENDCFELPDDGHLASQSLSLKDNRGFHLCQMCDFKCKDSKVINEHIRFIITLVTGTILIAIALCLLIRDFVSLEKNFEMQKENLSISPSQSHQRAFKCQKAPSKKAAQKQFASFAQLAISELLNDSRVSSSKRRENKFRWPRSRPI